MPGLDYRAKFDVPVFMTPESDPKFAVDPSAMADYVAPGEKDSRPPE